MEQSSESSCTPLHLTVVAVEKGAFGSPLYTVRMRRVFANGPGDQGSIPGRVIPKSQKMVLDAALLNTRHYKIKTNGKVEQPGERSSALPYTSVL